MRMQPSMFLLISACSLFLTMPVAHATISCSISSPGWVSSYFPTNTINATRSSQVTISCTRASGDASTQTYTLEEDNGLQSQGQTNQATSGTNSIKYGEYQDPAFANVWSKSPNAFIGTINFGTGTSTTVIIPYYASIPYGQNVAGGNYTDTVTMTLTYGTATATNTHTVLIIINPTCTITTPPGNFSFGYKSFQTAAANASTSFALTCTTSVPYSASLDAYAVTDTTTNIAYTLNVGQTISPAGSIYTPGAALTASGSGASQTISINASIAAGQSGTCSLGLCSGSTTRTMTITY